MKNKNIIALILGIACVMILSAVLIWSSLDRPADPPEQDEPSQEETQPPVTDSNQQPEEGQTNDPIDDPANDQTNGQTTDEPDDTGEQEPSQSEEDKPSSTGKLNPNPVTAAEIEAVLNDPFMILVNRERKVSSDYVGEDLVTYTGAYKLNRTCADALRQLIAAGERAGYSYTLYSGYRSYSSQYNKYYNKIASYKEDGKSEEEAIRLTNQYYAPPGASEHHTGLAADVCIPEIVNKYACLHENYDQTEEFEWFSTHAHEYGFILRYPNGDEEITGYNYEPWHYRYVGVEIATEIYNRGITLEEYVGELESRLAKFES
ncbi:MAG: D-alanyl-D-alanine carboxypeptidase family protein [Clostridia bacterium]|nr:D-alanyl-D-alanine carboxypeptidase family protein [Clostridia bacterium]